MTSNQSILDAVLTLFQIVAVIAFLCVVFDLRNSFAPDTCGNAVPSSLTKPI